MEIARTPVGGEGDTERCNAASCSRTAQHSVRDPSVYLFVNEGDETGNLIFGLCFPMASLDVDGTPLGPGESENGGGRAGHGPAGELGAATTRSASWASKLGTTPRDNHHALLLR